MEARLGLLLFTLCCGIVLAAAAVVADTEQQSHTTVDDPAARRMDSQRAVQINACLRYAPDAGCDTFACLKNMTCDVEDDLREICTDYLVTAEKLDLHGKRFSKDFLKCCAQAIKSRFGSSTLNCGALQRMLIYTQTKCYRLHNICPVLETNMEPLVNMLDLQRMIRNGAYVEYLIGLFYCGDKVITAIKNHLQVQLGPAFHVFRQLWQEPCPRVRTTPATVSKDDIADEENIRRGNWK